AAPGYIGNAQDHEIIVRAVWDSEVTAFERAAQQPALGRFLVPFFGPCRVSEVRDARGDDISSGYHLDCAYKVAFVPGEDRKIGQLMDHPLFPQIDAYVDELGESGIRSATDGSVFVPGLNAAFTLIDIGTWEAAAELTHALQERGSFPEHIKK